MFFFGSSYDPKRDIPDLTGKVAIVTGGNAGIGYETVKNLTTHGAKVYLGARNAQRGKDAILRLHQERGVEPGSVELLLVDLCSLKDAKRAGEEFLKREKRLDILINNAAQVATNARTMTNQGLTSTLATNHFGPFVFTTTLLPLMEATAKMPGSDVRIVNVASTMHEWAPLLGQITSVKDLDVAQETGIKNGMTRYGVTKLCNILFTRELQKRLTNSGSSIIALCLHPGEVGTPGTKAFFDGFPGILSWIMWPLFQYFFKSNATGAYASTFAATSVKVRQGGDKYKAVYLMPPDIITPLKGQALDENLDVQLWALTEAVVDKVLKNGSTDGEL